MDLETDRELLRFLHEVQAANNLSWNVAIEVPDSEPRIFRISIVSYPPPTLPYRTEVEHVVSTCGLVAGYTVWKTRRGKVRFRACFRLLRPTKFEKYFFEVSPNVDYIALGDVVNWLYSVTREE